MVACADWVCERCFALLLVFLRCLIGVSGVHAEESRALLVRVGIPISPP